MPSSLLSTRWLVAILALAVVVTGGVAYAAIPDTGGTIHSCYTKSSGAWRVIDTDAGQTCKSNEAALDLYSKGAADLTFLTKTGKAADADKLDGLDSTAFLGANAMAADSDKLDGHDSSDFLPTGGTAADSAKLNGRPASAYLLTNGGFVLTDVAIIADGAESLEFGCCVPEDPYPSVSFKVSCDTGGGTTLIATAPTPFSWWWDETSGDATPGSSGHEAVFPIGSGVERHTLRVAFGLGNSTTMLDLDTSVAATCRYAWTLLKSANASPGP